MSTTNWIQHPAILKGTIVTLLPLEEKHFEELAALGEGDETIWKYSPTGVNGFEKENALAFLRKSFDKSSTQEWYAFVMLHNASGKLCGFTQFHNIMPQHKTLEIGATWLHPDYWRKG